MFKIIYTSLLLIAISVVNLAQAKSHAVDLRQWNFVGSGFTAFDVNENQTILAENPGSQGVMLVSPQRYGSKVVLRYKIRPLTPESVLVAMLSSSNSGSVTPIEFPAKYNGSMKYLLTSTDSYFYAFHNAAHGKTPFVRKHAKELGLNKKAMISAPANVMTTLWYDVEVGNDAGHLWLKVDDKLLFETQDHKPLAGGNIILRLRGTADRIGISLIKDVTIEM